MAAERRADRSPSAAKGRTPRGPLASFACAATGSASLPCAVAAALLLSLALAGPARAGEGRRWSWPVRGPVLSGFRYGGDPFTRGQRRGISIGAPVGTEVRAACPGRVRFAGFAGSSGRTVSVACGRLVATYLHLGAIAVRAGERVWQGERLGDVGRSGRPRLPSPHLAFGARIAGRRWAYVDPLTLLEGAGRAPPPELVPAARRPKLPRLGPAPRPPAVRARVPRTGPDPARAPARVPRPAPDGPPFRVPRSAPDGALVRVPPPVGAPRPAGRPVSRPGLEPSGSVPLVAWLGLAALAGALIVVPAGRAGRRRRARAAAGAGAEVASR